MLDSEGKIAVNLLPATDTGADLDKVAQLFLKPTEEELEELLEEMRERIQELPVAILIGILTMAKGRFVIKVDAQRIVDEVRRRAPKDVEKLLRGLVVR